MADPLSTEAEQPRRPRRRRLIGGLALLLVLIVGLVWGLHWWTVGRFVEVTDDAYLRADSVTVAPRIAGYVAEVLVGDNQDVVAGQPLVRVDPVNYRATLARQVATRDARAADLAVVRAQLDGQLASVQQAEARTAGDAVDARYAASEAERYRRLAATGAETNERLAEMVNRRDRAQATLRIDEAGLVASQRQTATLQAQIGQAAAQVEVAASASREARLDVGNTVITAPVAGRVGDRTVRVGQFVQPGTRLLTLVPVSGAYVVANFKETQIGRMRIGQAARVSVDALGGRVLRAVVDSFAPGTGSEFALLPPENATGNFTKIVQRVPVRLRLLADDADRDLLVPGLSVTVSIDTQDRQAEAAAR